MFAVTLKHLLLYSEGSPNVARDLTPKVCDGFSPFIEMPQTTLNKHGSTFALSL